MRRLRRRRDITERLELERRKDEFISEEPIDLAALLLETVELLQPTSPTHTLIVRGTPHAVIMGDKDRFGQVLITLINNAIK